MKTVRVYEIASELNLPPKQVIKELNDLGAEIKSHTSGVHPEFLQKLKELHSPEEKAKAEKGKVGKMKSGKDLEENWIVTLLRAELEDCKITVKPRENPKLFAVSIKKPGRNLDTYTFIKTLKPNLAGIKEITNCINIVTRKDKKVEQEDDE